MNRPLRRAILAVGVPGSGKTVLHRRITDALLEHPGFDGIFVLDRSAEWSTGLDGEVGDLESQLDELADDDARAVVRNATCRRHDGPVVTSEEEFRAVCELLGERARAGAAMLPRRTIWRCGRDPKSYGAALRFAVDQGNMVIVFSESPDWFTSYERDWPLDNIPGREDVKLSQLYSQGRAHIPNTRGEPCPVHILTDSQDLMLVHWKVRKFSTHVLLSRLEGGESFACVQREFGDGTNEIARRVRELKPREWLLARPWGGEKPELAPFRGGGRRG